MDQSFVTQMDDSYFIIPTSQKDSIWPLFQGRYSTINERTKQQEFLDDVIQRNKEYKSLCHDCHDDLIRSLDSRLTELQSMLQAYQLASHSLISSSFIQADNQQSLGDDDEEEESEINEKSLDIDIAELRMRIKMISSQENDQTNQLDKLKQTSNSTLFAIEKEIRSINVLEAQETLNRQELIHALEITSISQLEIAFHSRSINHLSPLFYLSVTKETYIINGFRIAYQSSPNQNLSCREIQFSWSILCQMLLCLRNLHGLSNTLAFRADPFHFPITTTTCIPMMEESTDTGSLNDYSYKFMNKERPDGVPSSGTGSVNNSTSSNSLVYRFIQLSPLRHRASISLKTKVIGPHEPEYHQYSSKCSGANKTLSVNVPTLLRPGVQENLSKIQQAFATHTSKSPSSSPSSSGINNSSFTTTREQEPMKYSNLPVSLLSESILMSVLYESNIMYSLRSDTTESPTDTHQSHALANYQISIHLVAVFVVCTAIELNCADSLIDTESSLYPILVAIKSQSTDTDTDTDTDTADPKKVTKQESGQRLFRFIVESQAINIKEGNYNNIHRNQTDTPTIPSSSLQQQEDDDDDDDDIINGFESVFVHRGRSATEMNNLIRNIVITTQALSNVSVTDKR